MAAYGMGIIVAPIIGPTLGGWITDNYSWRWIFYINLPVGVAAVLMCNIFVEDPPYLRHVGKAKLDTIGLSLMAIGLSALQILLDKGEEEDWLGSNFIRWLLVFAVVGLVSFIIWEFITPNPLVDLHIFKDRNFAAGTIMIAIIGGVLYGSTALLPLFLQTLLGYPAFQSGLAVTPRGVGSFIATLVVGRLVTRVDTRLLLGAGFAMLSYGVYQFARLDLMIAPINIVWPNIATGLAFGFIFVPLTTTTMGTLPNEQIRNATGLYNLMRNIGGSVGISAVTAAVTRGAQRREFYFAPHLTPSSLTFQSQLHQLTALFTPHFGASNATIRAYQMLYNTVVQQGQLAAYIRDYQILSAMALACVPAVLVFRYVRAKKGAVAAD